LLRVNVFYREKTVLRQLFFRRRSARLAVALQTMDRALAKAIPAFQGHGNVILRFKPAAASAGMNGSGDVEEQQRLQGRL
jgi:hypothetical protein